MTADNVSRRTLLVGLGAWAAAGCSRLAFVAANVPAAFVTVSGRQAALAAAAGAMA
ncbi:MAG TPA: hypothetical protein VII35_07225 [Steroidobacteraceae bacterium]